MANKEKVKSIIKDLIEQLYKAKGLDNLNYNSLDRNIFEAEMKDLWEDVEAHVILYTDEREEYEEEIESLKADIDDLKDYAELKSKEEIKKQALLNRRKAGGTLDLREREMSISRPSPRNLNEFYQRVKALGVTPEQFMQDARERGFLKLPDMTMKERWRYAHLKQTGQIDPMAGYYDALREAEHAKALQDAKKRNGK